MQLISKRTFANNKLRGVGPIQAVDTICPCHPILQFKIRRLAIAIAEKASGSQHILCYGL